MTVLYVSAVVGWIGEGTVLLALLCARLSSAGGCA